MKPYSREHLSSRTVEELRQENLELEAKQKEIRKVRLQLAAELERRANRGQVPEDPKPQVVAPEVLVADVEVSGQRKRRFWR